MKEHPDPNVREWTGRIKWAFGTLGVVAGFFLIAEHRAHLLPYLSYLPFLLLAACPLMHIFMHGQHGGHSPKDGNEAPGPGRTSPSSHSRDAAGSTATHRP